MDVSPTEDDNFKHYYYHSYNFTLAIFWSPFLVKTQDNDPNGKAGKTFVGLFLDEANQDWTSQIDGFDYILISAGHWFFRPLIYYENRNFIGCRYCEKENLREYSLYYGYRSAFQTAFRAILARETFKGTVYLRTFVPSHFEGGDWDHGGDCLRKNPMKSNETNLEGENMEAYAAQMEAFNEAQKLAQLRGMKFGLVDMTRIMLMRPDGHPSMYGRPANANKAWPSDCVHWCLPGPIDSWNDFLFELLRSDEKGFHSD
ncbi:Protein trichome birefringence-like 19 [Bienertia sinuspersici]